jgi:hypothetical protein
VVDGVTETWVSELTLDGANDTLALESGLEMVPPSVGETIDCGGDRPLAVFAVGSGGVESVPCGVLEVSWLADVVVVPPTRTVTVPVPEPAAVVAVPLPFAGSPVPVLAVVPSPLVVVGGGVELVVVSCGSATDWEVSVVAVELPVAPPPVLDVSVVPVAGGSGVVGVMLLTFWSGAAFVSAGGTLVVELPASVLVGELDVGVSAGDCVVCGLVLDEVSVCCGGVSPCCN